MAKWKKQSHVVYQCSYHIVWCPKYRFRILEGAVAKYVEERIRVICEWKDSEIEELSVMKDHVHLVVTVPMKMIDQSILRQRYRWSGDAASAEAGAVVGLQ